MQARSGSDASPTVGPTDLEKKYANYKGDKAKDGRPHGWGSITFPNQNRYEGEWKYGKRTGKGTYYYSNGSKYEGQVLDGHLHGWGLLTFANGNSYVGEFRYGKREGRGTFTWYDGEKYEGEFKADKRDGRGTYYYTNKDRYEGQFSNGLKHGYGVYYYSKGGRYEGNFKNGQRDGFGVLYLPNGEKYEGQFKNDRQHGYGVVTQPNGNKYEGTFENDKKHGEGVQTIAATSETLQQVWNQGNLLSSAKVATPGSSVESIRLSHTPPPTSGLVKPPLEIPLVQSSTIPFKVGLVIFSFLDLVSLCRACQVCRSWNAIGNDRALWEWRVRTKDTNQREQIINYKGSYSARLREFVGEELRNGSGIYVYRNGDRYEGMWESSQRHGHGRMIYYTKTHPLDSFEETYEGNWERGKKSGWGKYIWSNGDWYEGMFSDGARNGHGVLQCINGDRYEGQWQDGQFRGRGTGLIHGGQFYDGFWHDGLPHGHGTLNFPNGDRFTGTFKEGKKQGKGTEIKANGFVMELEFDNGKPMYEPPPQHLYEPDWSEVRDATRTADRKKRIRKLLGNRMQF